MTMPQLPAKWDDTRYTLQAYSKALTAIPRAAGTPDDRWNYVAMSIDLVGLLSAPTPLADGSDLYSTIDLKTHEIVISANGDAERIDLTDGPSSLSIGEAAVAVAARHGTDIDADKERFGGSDTLVYNKDHAAAFFAAASYAATAFADMNNSLAGEVAGPHLWPHGFDIATEWYSSKMASYGDSEASAQIAVGFYPSNESYFYANPWPFEEDWASHPLPPGASWHLDGWQGAELPPAGIDHANIVAFGLSVHSIAGRTLSS
ncbi:MAG: DUF5996 family protein [Actinomycetia bacterium]|nr:DUF5996 family protein [Actinomycetes bacterium]